VEIHHSSFNLLHSLVEGGLRVASGWLALTTAGLREVQDDVPHATEDRLAAIVSTPLNLQHLLARRPNRSAYRCTTRKNLRAVRPESL
jgi:hypothetical protein